MNTSTLKSVSGGFHSSKLISHVFPQIFQPLILLWLASGCRVWITWCPWQVLLEQGSDVSPCSAISNWMWVNSVAGNLEKNVLMLYQLEPDGD